MLGAGWGQKLKNNTAFLTATFKFLRHSQRPRTFVEAFMSMNPRLLKLYTSFFLNQFLKKIHLMPLIFTANIDDEQLDMSFK